jgi:multidrug resistance protein
LPIVKLLENSLHKPKSFSKAKYLFLTPATMQLVPDGVLKVEQTDRAIINLIAMPDGVETPNGSGTPPNEPESSFEIVTWNGPKDPDNPQNWPLQTKILRSSAPLTVIFAIAFASSVFGAAADVIAAEYGVSQEVMSLGVALFIAGFATGPLVFAPMAEVVGNAPVLAVALAGCALFQLPLALAQSVATILVCRFLAGMLGSGGLAVGSGILADIYGPITRGVAVGMSASIMNIGSIIAPIAGAYIVDRYGWRWTAWVTLILCGVVGVHAALLLRESSHNRILMRRAARLRRETNNMNLRARAEMASLEPQVLLRKYCTKPVRMFIQEPILIVMTIYLTLVYGTLYLSYQLFPKAFQNRGWSKPIAALPFISVGLGVLSAFGLFSLFTMTWYKKRWLASQKAKTEVGKSSTQITPEHRLPPMILGAVILPPALLWFGWSGDVHWASQLIACFFIGMALQVIFISGIVYIVDTYLLNTVSAISIHVMVRSLVSAVFPTIEGPMYETLHINWSVTLLAGLSAVIMVSPIVFMIYGSRIRSWSRFSVGDN